MSAIDRIRETLARTEGSDLGVCGLVFSFLEQAETTLQRADALAGILRAPPASAIHGLVIRERVSECGMRALEARVCPSHTLVS